ncbi:MAG: hypothetical protein B7Z37_28115 [Verrucomicrobia bacterium 12-59-8]|nr:MAG: hypothetical protein B7Z37_28115 [Verrucomicrobia bacterium 12-59-8]
MNKTESQTKQPNTLAQEFGYSPKAFQEFNAKKRTSLLAVEKREQQRISNALQDKMAWQA